MTDAAKSQSEKLNQLQLKTLFILNEFAGANVAGPGEGEGEVRTNQIPRPYMDHFHVADGVVLTKDATGLFNRGVWAALERKGLMRAGEFPFSTTLTAEGIN